jgi:hypothetical protein
MSMTLKDVLKATTPRELRLVTGDILKELPDRQILVLHTGERLTVMKGGEWRLDGESGKVDVLTHVPQQSRNPQCFDLSNGARLRFFGGRIEIRYGRKSLVLFDPNGVIIVKREDVIHIVRQFLSQPCLPATIAG